MADKKITELPFIDTLSGSLVGTNTPIQNTVIPVVLRGTTNQINIENFSKFVNAYNATTGSNTFIGNQIVTGNVNISGRLTVNEVVAQYETSSILFSTGSTKLGDQLTDKHEFTGSTNVTGSLILNGSTLGFGELNSFTASQLAVNLGISSVTGALNTTTSSFDAVFLGISSVTGSINTTTSSFDSVFLGISSVTGALNTTTSSFDSVFLGISSVTGAMNIQSSSQDLVNMRISSTTGSINTTTSSFDSVFLGISSVTGSINTTTSSFDSVFLRISSTTGSINTSTSSFDSVFLGISSVTGSINTTTSSFDLVFRGISSVTGAMNTQSSSQDLVNLGLSIATGSLIGITNGLMAFTAALDSTYATDAQLYQLYQATSSVHFTTQSLNIQTGSQDLINRGISSVTGSINTTTSSFDSVFLRISSTTGSINTTTSSFDSVFLRISSVTGSINTTTSSFNNVFLGISSVTGAINTQTSSQDLVNLGISSVTGSLIGITNGLMAFTAALDTTYATDAQLYQLYQTTASIHFTTQSLNTQTGSQDLVNLAISTFTGSQNLINNSVDSHILGISTQTGSQDLVNLGISTFTGSLRGEVNGIESYTASLKNAFTIDGNNDVYFSGKITTQEVHTTYTTSSVLFQSGSTKFGNSSDDIHEFTGSKFEVFNSDTSGTMYAVVKNNRARNAAVKTTTTNGSFIAGTSIGTDSFQYQIYDEVEGTNRVTINSQGGTTLQGAVSASQTLRVSGKTQIGTSIVDTSLGSNTKLSVVGDGNVNSGASQGSLFVAAGNEGGDTGLPINMGTGGATMMLLASINTSTGTATNSATYIVRFYFDGNNAPTTTYLGGSSDFVTFGVTPTNTLAVSGSSSGNKSYAWFINKFGA
jgi:hypothetical protein